MRINKLRKAARILEKDFGVGYKSLTELPNSVKYFGECSKDRRIKIRLKHYNRNTPLADSTVVDTLCHELAHLLVWDHGNKHKAVLKLMLRRAWELLGQ